MDIQAPPFERDEKTVIATASDDLISEWGGHWLVAEVRPQHVFIAANRISDEGIRTYVPVERIVRHYNGQKREWDRAIWPGYLFACIPDDYHRYAVRAAFGVWGIIDPVNQDRLVNELSAIQIACAQSGFTTQTKLVKGVRCSVRSGPFQGKIGHVEADVSNGRVWFNLTMLGRSISAEIDAELLEIID